MILLGKPNRPMPNSFKQFLIDRNIKFYDEGDNVFTVSDESLMPYEIELREKFPEFEFMAKIVRDSVEPSPPPSPDTPTTKK